MSPIQFEFMIDLPRAIGSAWNTPVGCLAYSRSALKNGVRCRSPTPFMIELYSSVWSSSRKKMRLKISPTRAAISSTLTSVTRYRSSSGRSCAICWPSSGPRSDSGICSMLSSTLSRKRRSMSL